MAAVSAEGAAQALHAAELFATSLTPSANKRPRIDDDAVAPLNSSAPVQVAAANAVHGYPGAAGAGPSACGRCAKLEAENRQLREEANTLAAQLNFFHSPRYPRVTATPAHHHRGGR
jgi:hypothetical protein